MTDCDHALAAGGSPATWRRRLEPAAERLDAVDRVLRATCAWPAAPSLAGDRPLFGTTLTELTETVPARVSVRSTRSGTASVITHSPTAHPQMPRPTHAQPPVPIEPTLRPVARRSTADSRPTVVGPHSVHEMNARIPAARLRALAGDLPATVRTAPGSAVGVVAGARQTASRPDRHPQPGPGSTGAYLGSIAAAVSRRLGGDGSPPPDGRARLVPWPGPAAPAELLAGVLLGDSQPSVSATTAAETTPALGRVSRKSADVAADDVQAHRSHAAPSVPDPTLADHALHSRLATDQAVARIAAPGIEAANRTLVSPSPVGQPDVPVRDRTSALAPTLAPTVGPGPALFAGSSSSLPAEADLERLLERVLGDAARRHGIEV